MKTDVVLLPGMHGSTALFDPMLALAPPWARCRTLELANDGEQSFDALAAALEPKLRPLEGFVLFAESFSAPIAARLAQKLGQKVALLVLCNPLVESPLRIAPSIAARLLSAGLIPRWTVAHAMTGGDRALAERVLEETRALPRAVLAGRVATAFASRGEDLASRLSAPLLTIVGARDRLIAPATAERILTSVPFAVYTTIDAPHLAAQVAPVDVWAAISEEFQSAA